MHCRHPFPTIGDAAYHQHAREVPSHGHRQHAQKIGKDRTWFRRYPRGQTDRQTDILITILRNCSHGRSKNVHKRDVNLHVQDQQMETELPHLPPFPKTSTKSQLLTIIIHYQNEVKINSCPEPLVADGRLLVVVQITT